MIKLKFKYGWEMALNIVIRNARLKKNLKQENAAKLVGVTVQTYSKWENGKTEPKASQIAKLSEILGVSTNEICYGVNSKKLELIEFMKIVSEVSRGTSDFELKMAIWESIDDDETFIDNLRNYSSIPDRYLPTEHEQNIHDYMSEIESEPEPYDEKKEILKDYHLQIEEEGFIKGLNAQDRKTYENLVKKYKGNEQTQT